MKKTLLYKTFSYSVICLLLLLLNFSSFGQRVLSDDELMDSAYDAYHANRWVMASVYLFAYIQKRPSDISSNNDYANQVATACRAAFKRLKFETGKTTMALPNIGNTIGSDQLWADANTAIQSSNWASACIYIFAYFQKAGIPGEGVNEDVFRSYNQCKDRVYQAVSNARSTNGQQADNGDENASITSGLGEEPPPFSKPARAMQYHALTDVPMSFSGFSDAFAAVLHLYENDFSNYKGDLISNGANNSFFTKITIEDPGVKGASIFVRNNNWSFRFTLEGNAADETNQFIMEKQTIEAAFANLGVAYTTKVKPYQQGSVPLNSVEYKSNNLLVTIYPAIFATTYSDDVIITHLH